MTTKNRDNIEIMIRKANIEDIDAVALIYKNIHEAEALSDFTGWEKNVYPVRETAENAIERDDLFVCENEGKIVAAAIINQIQVDVYADCDWKFTAGDDEVMVLHTLVVDPYFTGKGIGREFVAYYEQYAKDNKCIVARMDTNKKNTPARNLYNKLGYREACIIPCVFNGISGVELVLLEKLL